MNVGVVLLSCLSMGAVDGAFLSAIFAIQVKKVTSATYLMPAFGIVGLAITILTALLHSRILALEAAERLSVSRQTVNALEVEKYDPSLQLAFKISDLFERSIHDIFCND